MNNKINNTRFNKENIKIVVRRMIEYARKQMNNDQSINNANNVNIVTKEVFESLFNKWDLTSVFSVREFVYNEV